MENGSIVEEYPDTYDWGMFFTNHTLGDFTADAAVKGFFSLFLTIVNIACIIATGVIVLRIKEVTSEKIPQQHAAFFKEHIKTQRNYNKQERKGTVRRRKNQDAGETLTLLEEVRDVLDIDDSVEDGLEGSFLHTLIDKASNDTDYQDILCVTGTQTANTTSSAKTQLLRKGTIYKSHRKTVANLNDLHRKSLLTAMEGANAIELKEKSTRRGSHVFNEGVENRSEDINTDILFKQAKIIQRSRTMGGGWKKRAQSKKRKQAQVDTPTIDKTNEKENTAADQVPEETPSNKTD